MPISKGEFARRRGVTPGRVSQWIAEGKIFGDAIVGEGRRAQIEEARACAQLGERLDTNQRHSANGLGTNITPSSPVPEQPAPGGEAPPSNTLERQLLEEKLEKARRDNRSAMVQEAIANGLLCDVSDARAKTGREVASIIARFEGALPEFASAIAAKFKLPQRDVLHELRAKWRQVRTDASIEARERATPMPESVGFALDEQ